MAGWERYESCVSPSRPACIVVGVPSCVCAAGRPPPHTLGVLFHAPSPVQLISEVEVSTCFCGCGRDVSFGATILLVDFRWASSGRSKLNGPRLLWVTPPFRPSF